MRFKESRRPKAIAYGDATDLFAKLLEMDDETVMRVMTLAMAVSLKSGSQTVEAVALTIPVDMAELWQPDEAFFSLLRDKRVINAMVADIAGDATAKAHLTDTAKKQREIILNRIAGNSTKPAPDWRPCWMRPVPSSYLKDKKCSVEACYCQAETILKPKKQRKKNAA